MSMLKLAGNSVAFAAGTHLQIVLQNGPSEREIEVQNGSIWNVMIDEDHTTGPNYGIVGSYGAATLDIGLRIADDVWEVLKQAAASFDAMQFAYFNFDYFLQSQNSNTFAYSMLLSIGIDASEYYGTVQTGTVLTGDWDIRDQVTFNIAGTDGADWFYAGAKDDRLSGGKGDDILDGGNGDDILIGGADVDKLTGGNGEDILIGGEDVDTLTGGNGADILLGSDLYGQNTKVEDDLIDGGLGTDYLVVTGTPGSRILVVGGDKQDRLLIHQSALGLVPVDENATEIPMLTLSGGVWGDVNYYGEWFSDNLFGQEDDANAYRSYTYFPDAPVTVFSGFVPDLLQRINYPENAPFTIEYKHYFNRDALEINVILQGEAVPSFTIAISDFHAGDYGIQLEPATRVVIIEYGDSGYVYTADQGLAAYTSRHTQLLDQSDDISIEVDAAISANRSAFAAINPTSNSIPTIRIAITGDVGGNTLTGNDVSEHLYGLDGNDVLRAAGGDDTVYGGNGDDSLSGGTGSDVLRGGEGQDVIVVGNGVAGDVDSIDGGTERDLLDLSAISTGAIWIDFGYNLGPHQLFTANGFASVANIDSMIGTAFDDIMRGDRGSNNIVGGQGNDTLLSYSPYDTLTPQASLGDVIEGGEGNDLLFSGSGNDYLDGGTGDDTIEVGGGTDTVVGGAGNDIIYFSPRCGVDTIVDFELGDVLRLYSFGTDLDSYAEVFASASQVGYDTQIMLTGTTIILQNVSRNMLVADNFLFA
jgi:Ca2+-binding RTX toxin-like protein